MNGWATGLLLSLNLLGCAGPAPTPATHAVPLPLPSQGSRVWGNSAVGRFDGLTAKQRQKILERRAYFEHASVGANVVEGLRQVLPGLKIQSAGTSSEAAAWLTSNEGGFVENNRGNPGCWQKVKLFDASASMPAGTVAMMKFCYIDDDSNTNGLFEAYRDAMTGLSQRNPDVVYVWWTMPLMTSGNERRIAFNEKVRAYCREHRLPFFDIASVEADGESGDMKQGYSSDGGHLNGEGQQRVAKALCVMLADL